MSSWGEGVTTGRTTGTLMEDHGTVKLGSGQSNIWIQRVPQLRYRNASERTAAWL